MDRDRIEECLEHVAAYQASGKKAKQWAVEQGVPLRHLASWCAHAQRWQARLDGVPTPIRAKPKAKPSGFIQARLAPSAPAPESAAVRPQASVRIELQTGAAPLALSLALHWPLSHTRELATWLRGLQ